MRTADFDERTMDCDDEEGNERTRTAPRRSRHEFTYARKTKRTTNHGGMHRRKNRRWNW